jgi:hypothetical protein
MARGLTGSPLPDLNGIGPSGAARLLGDIDDIDAARLGPATGNASGLRGTARRPAGKPEQTTQPAG